MEVLASFFAAVFVWIGALGIFGWMLLLVCCALIFPLTKYEWNSVAVGTFLVVWFLVYALTGFNIALWARHNPVLGAVAFLGWFAFGAVWVRFLRWPSYSFGYSETAKEKHKEFIETWKTEISQHTDSDNRHELIKVGLAFEESRGRIREPTDQQKFKTARQTALDELNAGRIPETLLNEWRRVEPVYSQKLRARNCKSMIMGWLILWPWSVLRWALGDFLELVWHKIVNALQGVTDKHYAGMDEKAFR